MELTNQLTFFLDFDFLDFKNGILKYKLIHGQKSTAQGYKIRDASITQTSLITQTEPTTCEILHEWNPTGGYCM